MYYRPFQVTFHSNILNFVAKLVSPLRSSKVHFRIYSDLLDFLLCNDYYSVCNCNDCARSACDASSCIMVSASVASDSPPLTYIHLDCQLGLEKRYQRWPKSVPASKTTPKILLNMRP